MASPVLTWGTESFTFAYGLALTVNKDFTRNEDGSVLTEKHIITVKGAYIAGGGDGAARIAALAGTTVGLANIVEGGGGRESHVQMAPLTISVLGVSYPSVSLTSVSTSEPPEDTAGIQYQEVTLTFETYTGPSDPTSAWKLRSASESFEIKREDDKVTFDSYSDITTNTLYFGYTITHTVSAQGLINHKDKKEAFQQAYKYVESKKMDNLAISSQDIFGAGLYNTLDGRGVKVDTGTYLVAGATAAGYTEYNRTRVASADVAGGSYSITETYFKSKKDATFDITANFNKDEQGDASVTVEGTIEGLTLAGMADPSYDKLSQAEAVYNALSGGDLKSGPIYALASDTFGKYSAIVPGTTLRNYPMQATVSKNKNKGTVNFNVSYKAYGSAVVGLINIFDAYKPITATATISDNNRLISANALADEKTIVSISVIGRGAYGPILQDMGVTKDRKRTAVVEVVVEGPSRTAVNDGLRNLVVSTAMSYAPAGGNVYVDSFSESWDWTVGKCSASIGWIYQK